MLEQLQVQQSKGRRFSSCINIASTRDVLFIDEIHRLHRSIEEVLYPAMEDFCLDIVIGKGPSARSVRLDLPPFTLVGATTRAGALSAPLRDRFGVLSRLEYYTVDQLSAIVERTGEVFEVEINSLAALEIARRARGTPRIANRLLRRVRDFAQVRGNGTVTMEITQMALELLQVDKLGLIILTINYCLVLLKNSAVAQLD